VQVRVDERVLRRVARQLSAAEAAVAERQRHVLTCAHELIEGRTVARLRREHPALEV
jgi:hypothetical protein